MVSLLTGVSVGCFPNLPKTVFRESFCENPEMEKLKMRSERKNFNFMTVIAFAAKIVLCQGLLPYVLIYGVSYRKNHAFQCVELLKPSDDLSHVLRFLFRTILNC